MPTTHYPEINFHLQFAPFQPRVLKPEYFLMPLKLDHITLLYVYGLGEGSWFSQVEEWLETNSSHVLVILEDDLGVIAAFLKMPSAGTILHHPQIYLKFVASKEMWEKTLGECAKEFPYDHLYVTALPSYAKKKHARFRHIKLKIQRKTVLWNALLSEELLAPLFHKNILANIWQLPNTFYVNLWRGTFKGIPAIICGAGPSLVEAQDILKKHGNQALIFAGGSAISALSYMNITPHFAVAIDPNPQEYEHLKNLTCPQTPLIFSSRLLPKARALFSGPLGYLSSKTGGPLEAYLEKKLKLEEPSIGTDLGQEALSVTTLATSLAYALGCDPIIFVGVDMAYTGSQMYAPGVIESYTLGGQKVCDQPIVRKNTQGNLVSTLVKWVMESEALSQYAKSHPDRLFFNASPKGLGFKHIPNKNLEDILRPLSRDLKEEIGKKIAETKLSISQTDIEALFLQIQQSLERCLVLTEGLLQEEGLESGKKILLEMDLQEEIAYQPLLEGTLFAFELARKKSFLIPDDLSHPLYFERALRFEKAKWYHLKECLEQELISLAGIVPACCATSAN